LTADNVDRLRATNLSGRYFKHPITVEHLETEISKLPAFDRERLRRKIVEVSEVARPMAHPALRGAPRRSKRPSAGDKLRS